ncbi:MAG: glycosyltransferase family 2 protein [Pseudomonadota bacterium]
MISLYLLGLALIVYSYAVYPLLLRVLVVRFGRFEKPIRTLARDELPHISILVAAHNEEAVIRQRVDNLLELAYPKDRIEILIASDGSTDNTEAIVREFEDPRVKLLAHSPNRGKAATLNRYVSKATGSVVVFSDANTTFEPDAAHKLANWLADPRIAAVSGSLGIRDASTGNNVDSAYWRYENLIKHLEGRLGAKLGANGAIYAIRREEYVPIPDNAIVDDFLIPLLIKIKTQGLIVYEPAAKASEVAPEHIDQEFQRRVRIGVGAYQSLSIVWSLLNPKYGWTSFCFFSHKVLRWATPLLMCMMFLISIIGLNEQPEFLYLLAGEVVLVVVAAVGLRVTSRGTIGKLLKLNSMFFAMNLALLFGWYRYVTTEQTGTWKRTER